MKRPAGLRIKTESARRRQVSVLPGHHIVGAGGSERFEYRVGYCHRHGHPGADRRRLGGANNPARRQNDFQWPKRAFVDRQEQRCSQKLKRHLGRRAPRCRARIIWSRDLRADSAQVDGHFVFLYYYTHSDRNIVAAVDAVVVHERFSFVAAIRNLAHGCPGETLALLTDQRDALFESLVAVTFEEL